MEKWVPVYEKNRVRKVIWQARNYMKKTSTANVKKKRCRILNRLAKNMKGIKLSHLKKKLSEVHTN